MAVVCAVEVRSVVEDFLVVEKHSRRAEVLKADLAHLLAGLVQRHPGDDYTLARETVEQLPENLRHISRAKLEVHLLTALLFATSACLYARGHHAREFLRIADRIGEELRTRK